MPALDRETWRAVRRYLWRDLALWARMSNEEVCGLLYPDGPHLVLNVAARPKVEFAMDPDEQMALMGERGWPLATFHTHPAGTRAASSIDHANALPGIPYAIGCPDGWVGLWVDGAQIGEAVMASGTNDVVEVYEDESGQWRWRRTAINGATIASSGESFDNKANAIRAARRANPDAFENDVVAESGAASDALGGGTGGATPAPGAPGTGTGGNAYGVGPTGP